MNKKKHSHHGNQAGNSSDSKKIIKSKIGMMGGSYHPVGSIDQNDQSHRISNLINSTESYDYDSISKSSSSSDSD